MTGKRPEGDLDRSSLEETLEQHHTCMSRVAELEEILDRHPDEEGRWIGRIRQELPLLRDTLSHHFKEEQEAALYRELPVRYPRFAERIEKLASEHDGILEAIDKVTAAAQGLQRPELHDLRELNARIQLLVATIRRHEAEENELIMSAHWDEVGTGD
jgi:iron-sulfur cluster repair protein YtfE (RIC family)